MKRCFFLASSLFGVALAAVSCTPSVEDTGSKTNWFDLCEFESDCEADALCICGVCTEVCEEDSCTPPGTCLSWDDPRLSGSCSAPPVQKGSGVCAAECGDETVCPAGAVCVGDVCVRAGERPCDEAAHIEILDGPELFAREGCHVSAELYLPVSLSSTEGWDSGATPHELGVSVTDEEGNGVANCPVRFLADVGHGLGLPLTQVTDEAGMIRALWIAGTEEEQILSASVLRGDGAALSATAQATVFAHDEGPQAPVDPTPVVRPSSVVLHAALPEGTSGIRTRLTAQTMPHHAFYGAVFLPGLYAGLQNVETEGDDGQDVPAESRVFIASIWNTELEVAELLESSDNVVCVTHTDSEGGLRCNIDGAWEPGETTLFATSWQAFGQGSTSILSDGSEAPPCVSAAGCTDYRVTFWKSGDPEAEADLFLTFRRPELAEPTGSGAFVQPYGTTDAQTSCLLTPRYRAEFSWEALTASTWRPLTSATAYSVYLPENNEVCANYAAHQEGNTFTVSSGGSEVYGVPYRPEYSWPVGP